MSTNELPPEMLAQAQMLGGQRTPTEHEITEMQANMIAMAHVQVASAVATAMLDGDDRVDKDVQVTASLIAETILDRSEENELSSKELTSMRNQISVGLICADIRGGGLQERVERNIEVVDVVASNFERVEKMISSGKLYAQKQISTLSE
jgi:hypothetical protein